MESHNPSAAPNLTQRRALLCWVAVLALCGATLLQLWARHARTASALAAHDPVAASAVATALCLTPVWDKARTLTTPDGNTAFVERPVIVRTPAGLVLLGAPAMELDARGAPVLHAPPGATQQDSSWPGRMVASGFALEGAIARAIPLPRESNGIAEPQGAVDGDDVHMLWTEAAPDTPPDATPSAPIQDTAATSHRPPVTLWYARWSHGTWSRAESVAALADPQWDHWQSTGLLPYGGELHLIVPVSGVPNRAAAYLRRSAAGRWTVTMFAPGRLNISYTRLAIDTGGRLTLAFISGSEHETGKWNRVYVSQSNDHGGTWTEPDEVRVPWTGPAYDLQLVSGDAVMHLLWIERPLRTQNNGALEDSVRIVSHRRGDQAWRAGGAYAVPHSSSGLQAIATGDGAVHTVVRADAERGELLHGVWREGQWAVEQLAFGAAAALPSLAIADSGGLALVWGAARQTAFGAVPESMISTTRQTCARSIDHGVTSRDITR